MLTETFTDPAMAPARTLRPENETMLPHPRNFQGIPGVAITAGDHLHAVWYGGGSGEGPDNFTMLARSRDGGLTWSGIHTVIFHDHPMVRTFDPVVWTAPDGVLWVFYAQAFQWWDGRAGVWAITCCQPDAETMEWSVPRRIADGVMMNKPTVLRDGRWFLPVAGWSHAPCDDPGEPERWVPKEFNHWGSVTPGSKVIVSMDGGVSFQEISSLAVDNVCFDEHMLVEKRDGRLWMLIRGIDGIIESFSRDGGKTWSPPAPSAIPHIDSRFFIRRLFSGRLLLIRHQTPAEREGSDAGGPPAGELPPGSVRAFLTAYLSEDDGETWSGGLLLDERKGVSYPDGDQLADGRIVITYDYKRRHEKIIYLASFSEEDVFAGACLSGGSGLRMVVNQGPTETAGKMD